MASQPLNENQKTSLLKGELEACNEVFDKLARILKHTMTKQTDENFPEYVATAMEATTNQLNKKVMDLTERVLETERRAQESLEKMSDEVKAAEARSKQLEQACDKLASRERAMSRHICELTESINKKNQTIEAFTKDLDSKQEIISQQSQEIEDMSSLLDRMEAHDRIEEQIHGSMDALTENIKEILEHYEVDDTMKVTVKLNYEIGNIDDEDE